MTKTPETKRASKITLTKETLKRLSVRTAVKTGIGATVLDPCQPKTATCWTCFC